LKVKHKLKKITLISPQNGTVGTDINYYKIAQALSKKGHMVILLVIGDEWNNIDLDPSIKKINLIPRKLFSSLKILNYFNWKLTMIFACFFSLLPFLYYLIRNKNSNYLLGLVPIFPMMLLILTRAKGKVVFSIQGLPRSKVFSLNLIIAKLIKNIQFVIPNKGMTNYITDKYNFSDFDKLRVIENAVLDERIIDMSNEQINESLFDCSDVQVLLGIGRLTPQKNFEMLIESFHMINKKRPNTRLIIIGEGNEKRNLIELVDSLNLNDNVIFLGYVKNPFKYMKSAHLFVMSSRWEGPGHVLIEALGVGCPVITTDCPSGPKETIQNGKYGLLVENENKENLAEAIDYALDNIEIMKSKVEDSKNFMKKYYTEQVAQKYLNLFNN